MATTTAAPVHRFLFKHLLVLIVLLFGTATASDGWPWMKGADMRLDSPIDPVCNEDIRPSVLELIQEYRESIDRIKKGLQKEPLYIAEKHDDLWILRFFLSSKKKAKAALRAARSALKFPKKYNLDDADIRQHPATMKLNHASIRKFLSCCKEGAMSFTVPDPQRGVVTYFDYAGISQHKMMEILPLDERLVVLVYVTEWSFQWLDYITRTTGLYTLEVRLLDMKGFQLSDANFESVLMDGKAMRLMEDAYPQMLESIYITNSPSWLQTPWRILRPILPKRVISKIDFTSPDTNEEERHRLSRFVTEDNLPVRFGGKNPQWPVPPLANDGEEVCSDDGA